jgi:hypothetical protein
VLGLGLVLGGCERGTQPEAVAPAGSTAAGELSAGADVVPAGSDPGPEAAAAGGEFLLLRDTGELTLSTSGGSARVLARGVADASYDPALELVWIQSVNELRVYDLRKPASESVLIAHGLSGARRLQVEHAESRLLPDDGCDLPFVELGWSRQPTLVGMVEEVPDLRLEGTAWLSAELARPRREVPRARLSAFDLRAARVRVPLPPERSRCEEPAACGAAVSLPGWGIELVLVQDQMGEDCWTRSCLLRDPETDRYATPPLPEHWGPIEETEAGTCGPFQFDQSGQRFLLERSLCSAAGCRKLGGRAIGWRDPGATVGTPGAPSAG